MAKLIVRISVSVDCFIEASNQQVNFNKSRSPEGAAWLAEKIAQAGVENGKSKIEEFCCKKLAEREGFEPSVRFKGVRQFSKLLVSATHPSLRKRLNWCDLKRIFVPYSRFSGNLNPF